ncbi:MAG TPA: thiamine phosphate synthase [Candidatus Acidoferrales bacterium]|nr:thiamine phosphate synthase [Candidatus Acidoferrales bacterium]
MASGVPQFRLCLVTDRKQTQGRDLLWVVEEALGGGVKAVQLREKDLGGAELFRLAEKTKRLCAGYGAALLVNDRIDVALAVDADGVQLGKASIPVGTARALVGGAKLIGYSAHSLSEAREARRDGADFIVFGPVYFTPAKAGYGDPQGLAALAEVAREVAAPVYAIGGINAANIVAVRQAGAYGAALISAILAAPDPRRAAEELVRLL